AAPSRSSGVPQPPKPFAPPPPAAVPAPPPPVVAPPALPRVHDAPREDPPPAPPPLSGVSMERLTNLDDLLRLAASCGASTLYLAPDARPSVRVGGEVWVLEDIP